MKRPYPPIDHSKFEQDLEAAAELYGALGESAASWQYVENAMYLLAHGLMRTSFEISSICFFHTKSAENRGGLLDKLCRYGLPQSVYQGQWASLRKQFSLAIKRRNALAHFEVAWIDAAHVKRFETDLAVVLSTPMLDYAATMQGATGYTVERIDDITQAYKGLASAVIRFVIEYIPNWPQQEALLPPHHQQFLQTARKMMTEAESAPPREPSAASPQTEV